jgi:hypothetical protein
MQIISIQRDLNWHLSNIIEMYWFIDTIVTTTFCHEFVRNISAKIGCNPFCSVINNNNLCILRTKCSPSQTLDDDPHNVQILRQRRWWFDRRSFSNYIMLSWICCEHFSQDWMQSLLLLSNGPELALHRHDRELKKTCINCIPNVEWLEFQTPFKCILVGLMNMIDGMRFWTPFYFDRHNTVLVNPWLCCIDKWHAESL